MASVSLIDTGSDGLWRFCEVAFSAAVMDSSNADFLLVFFACFGLSFCIAVRVFRTDAKASGGFGFFGGRIPANIGFGVGFGFGSGSATGLGFIAGSGSGSGSDTGLSSGGGGCSCDGGGDGGGGSCALTFSGSGSDFGGGGLDFSAASTTSTKITASVISGSDFR
ncbi:MAG: hypothetical protein CMF67_09125 [Magnetovibrio sp.]|nr:hypothetical protein [Magnetovibrio sp.]